MEYIFSFYVKENDPYIKRPKWYEFWKKPTLIDNYASSIRIARFKSENEEECLKLLNGEVFREIIKQTHNEPMFCQLKKAQDPNTNYFTFSEDNWVIASELLKNTAKDTTKK